MGDTVRYRVRVVDLEDRDAEYGFVTVEVRAIDADDEVLVEFSMMLLMVTREESETDQE